MNGLPPTSTRVLAQVEIAGEIAGALGWTKQILLCHYDVISLNDARDVVQTTFPTAD